MDNCRKCGLNPPMKRRRVCVVCRRAECKAWYESNKESVLQRHRTSNHPSRTPEARKAYNARNADTIQVYDAYRKINYRAKKFGHDFVKLGDIKKLVAEYRSCEDCGSTKKLTIGHRIPLVNLAANNLYENLIRQCSQCNGKQGQRIHVSIATDELRKHFRIYNPNN